MQSPEHTPPFPWRNHTDMALLTEFARLRKHALRSYKSVDGIVPYSNVGYMCSNHFFQYVRMATPKHKRLSTVEYWNREHKKITRIAAHMGNSLFATANYITRAPSQFPPVVAARLYRLLGAHHIFDPFAGWGDRCLAAMALGIRYTGVDRNSLLKTPFASMIKFYGQQDRTTVLVGKSVSDIDLTRIEADVVLSSPPFWFHKANGSKTIVEAYEGTDPDYDAFMRDVLVPLVKACLNRSGIRWVALHLPDAMAQDLSRKLGRQPDHKIRCRFHNRKTNHENVHCWRGGVAD